MRTGWRACAGVSCTAVRTWSWWRAARHPVYWKPDGAGGWRVPLGPRETLADVAIALGVDVIMVVAMRLGCINHALLTAEAIRADGLRLAGWVANQPGPAMICHAENLDTLQRLLPAPLLGEVPLISPFSAKEASQHIDISIK